ncbi:MAG: hypothetical protein H6739_21395 [Alphaproteobacteria bacterium]|nr:hypothetical protein [Alphaproteobacteria bacterium]
MLLAEPIEIALRVGDVLDTLGVPWLVGGSVASSLHGIPRATQDIDLVAQLMRRHVPTLVEALEADFYIDADMIRDAIHRVSSFNIIHLPTMTKVDVFLLRGDRLSQAEMKRRCFHSLGDESGRTLPLASAEDIILQKLDWYRQSGGVSERQWRDVLGVMKIQGEQLDIAYLREQARDAGLEDLLIDALAAGPVEH